MPTETAWSFVYDQQSDSRWKNYAATFGRVRRILCELCSRGIIGACCMLPALFAAKGLIVSDGRNKLVY